jgi:hypothetical protein
VKVKEPKSPGGATPLTNGHNSHSNGRSRIVEGSVAQSEWALVAWHNVAGECSNMLSTAFACGVSVSFVQFSYCGVCTVQSACSSALRCLTIDC